MRWWLALGLSVLAVGCSRGSAVPAAAAAAAPAAPKLGIRPADDTEIQPDLSKIQNDDLKKVFTYIDEHVDDHVVALQKWIRQPSISNSGEGIPESAEMVKGFFEQLGCQESRVYDVGITEWGAPGNPVVYAKCDEGAPRTIAIYWQYDRMPITQPDAWKAPPFEARIVEQPPFKKVLIGRGATNSKGPEMAQLNALLAIKAVTGKLPVNVVFVAEGDEERMDVGVRKVVKDHPDLFKNVDALIGESGQQSPSGGGSVGGGSGGGAGAILPNKITSKHNMRYIPKMNGLEMVKRIREQLDRNGYKDVEMKIIGDVPWSKMAYDSDIARAMTQMYDQFNIPHGEPAQYATILGGYWPSYLVSNEDVGPRVAPVSMPIGMGGAGHGGGGHASHEFLVIVGSRQGHGL